MVLQTGSLSTRRLLAVPHHVTWGSRRSALFSRLRRQAGFTVVELLIDVSLLAAMGLIAVILMMNYVEAGKARTAAEQVAAAFQQARQYAISQAATYTVSLTGTALTIACSAGCPPNAPSEPSTLIANGATTTVPSPAVTFDALGCANATTLCGTATAQTVTVTYPGGTQWQVRVTPAGRVRLCSPTCT